MHPPTAIWRHSPSVCPCQGVRIKGTGQRSSGALREAEVHPTPGNSESAVPYPELCIPRYFTQHFLLFHFRLTMFTHSLGFHGMLFTLLPGQWMFKLPVLDAGIFRVNVHT